jgi:chemotaxis protein methyltransferase CheR
MELILSDTEFELFKKLINNCTGISLSDEKKVRFKRKVEVRLHRLGLTSYNAYYRYLRQDMEDDGLELRQLINAITVDVTEFFRHPKQFEIMNNVVLPQITTQKNRSKKLRIWSAGCSRGHEAYSIAMLVDDMVGQRQNGTWDVKILASDIDTDALRFAYIGKYPSNDIKGIPSNYLDKYFESGTEKDDGFFLIKKSLKKNILFRRLNLSHFDFTMKSPVDIIFCRNVMIYFNLETKKLLIDNFFNAMQQGGVLFLGSFESLFGLDDRFTLISDSIYQKES